MIVEREPVEFINRYSRQIIIFGVKRQLRLSNSRVAIIGCGATGSSMAEILARAGVGFIRVVDRDTVEVSNLHRTHLFTEEDAFKRVPKAIACKSRLKEIDSGAGVEAIIDDADVDNIESLIEDVDLVIDGTDNMDTRYLINEACVKLGKPWIMIGVEGWYGNTKLIVPGKTSCLKCFTPSLRSRGSVCEFLGVTPSAIELVTAVASSLALRYLLDGDVDEHLYVVDSYQPSIEKLNIKKNAKCSLCSNGQFEYLSRGIERVKVMCGAKSVKITPENSMEVNFKNLTSVIENLRVFDGSVAWGSVNNFEIIILRNGKMFIKGTTDTHYSLELYKRIMSGGG